MSADCPGVVIMDFKLPDRNGDEVTAGIRAGFPDARVILLSIFENPESIRTGEFKSSIAVVLT